MPPLVTNLMPPAEGRPPLPSMAKPPVSFSWSPELITTLSSVVLLTVTPIALAPETAQSCTAIGPSPPEAPHTSTLWPGRRMCGRGANRMR